MISANGVSISITVTVEGNSYSGHDLSKNGLISYCRLASSLLAKLDLLFLCKLQKLEKQAGRLHESVSSKRLHKPTEK